MKTVFKEKKDQERKLPLDITKIRSSSTFSEMFRAVFCYDWGKVDDVASCLVLSTSNSPIYYIYIDILLLQM